jgi:hypothetical protein
VSSRRTVRYDIDRSRTRDFYRRFVFAAEHDREDFVDAIDSKRCVDGSGRPELRLNINAMHDGLQRHAPVPEADRLIRLPPRPRGVTRRMREELRKQLRVLILEPLDRALGEGLVGDPLAVERLATETYRHHLVVVHRRQVRNHLTHIPARAHGNRLVEPARGGGSDQVAVIADVVEVPWKLHRATPLLASS